MEIEKNTITSVMICNEKVSKAVGVEFLRQRQKIAVATPKQTQ
jgi:hypothetical protein